MTVTSVLIRIYEEMRPPAPEKTNPNKPNQSQCSLCEFFLFFTFRCPSYNQEMETWTIQRLLNWITGHFTEHNVDSPRLSAELLLGHVLDLKRIDLYTQFEKVVSQGQLNKLHDLVKRCAAQEPLAYLIGRCEFYSLDIKVTPNCMIPRPETELLVEKAIDFLRKREGKQFVCDLCTGSGCIAVAIAKNCPDIHIVATDICDSALSVAAKNVAGHNLDERVTLLCGDLFSPIIEGLDNTEFDLIVCNPPYVSSTEYEILEKNVKDHEPKHALFAGTDGLDIYRRIAARVDEFLKPEAALMLEIGYAQGKAVRELLEQTGVFGEIKIEKDHQNNDRVVFAKKSTWNTSQKPGVSEEVT